MKHAWSKKYLETPMRPLYIICLNINYKINTNILLQALVLMNCFMVWKNTI